LCYRRMATNAQLNEALAHINALDSVPYAVIASCDLTDHGRAEEYDVFREILASLLSPVFVITSRGGIVGGGDQITRTKSS
jgi:Icc protein